MAAAALLLGAASARPQEPGGRDAELPGFQSPFAFAGAPGRTLYVLEDLQKRVSVAKGRSRVQALPLLQRPAALDVDETGTLWVLDARSPPALVSFREGRDPVSRSLAGDVLPGAATDLAARLGVVWVVDRNPPRLLLYAYDGALVGRVDLAGLARAPFSIALGTQGDAFVTDPLGPAVLSFSAAGSLLGSLSLEGTGVTRPTGIAVDASGRVWVSDGVIGIVAPLPALGSSPGSRQPGPNLRFTDPLRLLWWQEALWVLEGRMGRVRRVEAERP